MGIQIRVNRHVSLVTLVFCSAVDSTQTACAFCAGRFYVLGPLNVRVLAVARRAGGGAFPPSRTCIVFPPATASVPDPRHFSAARAEPEAVDHRSFARSCEYIFPGKIKNAFFDPGNVDPAVQE